MARVPARRRSPVFPLHLRLLFLLLTRLVARAGVLFSGHPALPPREVPIPWQSLLSDRCRASVHRPIFVGSRCTSLPFLDPVPKRRRHSRMLMVRLHATLPLLLLEFLSRTLSAGSCSPPQQHPEPSGASRGLTATPRDNLPDIPSVSSATSSVSSLTSSLWRV